MFQNHTKRNFHTNVDGVNFPSIRKRVNAKTSAIINKFASNSNVSFSSVILRRSGDYEGDEILIKRMS